MKDKYFLGISIASSFVGYWCFFLYFCIFTVLSFCSDNNWKKFHIIIMVFGYVKIYSIYIWILQLKKVEYQGKVSWWDT